MSESKMEIDKFGTKFWRNSKGEHQMEIDMYGNKTWRNSDRKLHRTDGPAVEWLNGDKVWCIEGELHRIGCPAIERSNGDKEWYINGKFHRTDGPAIEYSNGFKVWYVNGKFLGKNDKGFWALWELLSDKDRANPSLLTYLPEKF
jgi:hypothetical protein